MGKPWKYYAKWNKPDTKGQISWFHFSLVFRIGKFIEVEITIAFTRGQQEENGQLLFKGYKISVQDDEKFLEIVHNIVNALKNS